MHLFPTNCLFRRLSPLRLLGLRLFRQLWIGKTISLVGDQFYMFALPWLLLQLTGDALDAGTILLLVLITLIAVRNPTVRVMDPVPAN
jgi:hypothetical protein